MLESVDINATVFGQFIVGFMILCGLVCFLTTRKRFELPMLLTFIGVLLAIIPPLGLIYMVVLLFMAQRRPVTTESV
ncbi:hypothetical protein [Idiomarina xiamenensis]|uniref:Uncharacterized protein n=1 Tax=Idiomarina xiamenensis 10-D-4 TaxID=740709 RepID=K2KLM3_9GAMM|nr:hypothetical protein [Idiomarina xiamenensis]EKE87487.1 hypothetical protein A10D4_00285 [Idiomarina xiamenensis 10-D-4]